MSALRTSADEFIPLPLHVRNVNDSLEDDLDEEDEDGPVDEDDDFGIDDEEDDDEDDADDEDLDTEEAIDEDEKTGEDDELDEQREEMRIRRQQIEDDKQSSGYQREAEMRARHDEEDEAQRLKDNENGAAMEEDESSTCGSATGI